MALKAKGTIVVPNPTVGQPNVELDIEGGAVDSIDNVLPSGFIGTIDPTKNVQLTEITTEDQLKLLKNTDSLVPGKFYVTEDGGPQTYFSAVPIFSRKVIVPRTTIYWQNISQTSVSEVLTWTATATGFLNIDTFLIKNTSTMSESYCKVLLRDNEIIYHGVNTNEQSSFTNQSSGQVWISKGEIIRIVTYTSVGNSYICGVTLQLNDYDLLNLSVPVSSALKPDYPFVNYNCIPGGQTTNPPNLSFLIGHTTNGHTIQSIQNASIHCYFQQGTYDPVTKIAKGPGSVSISFEYTINNPILINTEIYPFSISMSESQTRQMFNISSENSGSMCSRSIISYPGLYRNEFSSVRLENKRLNIFSSISNTSSSNFEPGMWIRFITESNCDFNNVKFL